MSSENTSQNFKYAGFISYSRKDTKWAKKIHNALERYRLPIKLEEKGQQKKRLGKFFRDEDELAGSSSLGASLRGALEDSKALIVICSPNAVASNWVNEEIRYFKSKRPSAPVFGVIVDGKPDSEDETKACFPKALIHAIDSDGNLTNQKEEPLAPDLTQESFSKVKVRLAAGLLGVSFDDFWKREQRRTNRNKAFASVSFLALCAVGYFAFDEYASRAREAAVASIIQKADKQSQEALEIFNAGDRRTAFILAASAIPKDLPEQYLNDFIDNFETLDKITNTRVVDLPVVEAVQGAFSPDGRFVVTQPTEFITNEEQLKDLSQKEGLKVWNATSGELIKELMPPEQTVSEMGNVPVVFSQDGHFFASASARRLNPADTKSQIFVWDTSTWNLVMKAFAPARGLALNANSNTLLSIADDDVYRFWNIGTGEQFASLPNDKCGIRSILDSFGETNFYFAKHPHFGVSGAEETFKDWCQGAMEPGIYEFDPNKKSLKLITRVNPSDVLNRTMIYKELIATRKENGNIEVIDKNKNVKYKDIDKSVSQHGSFSAVKVKSKTVLIIVEMNNDIHFYDIENRELIENPFDHEIKIRDDATISNGTNRISSGIAAETSTQIFWQRAIVEDITILGKIIASQPDDWKEEIERKRISMSNLSTWKILHGLH